MIIKDIYKTKEVINIENKHIRWTGEEIEKFISMYPTAPLEVLEEEFHLKRSSLNSAAHRYGVKRKRQNPAYTEDIYHNFYNEYENEFIKNNYLDMSDEEIAEVLGRSRISVKNHRNEMGLHRVQKNKISYDNTAIYVRRHNVDWKMASMKNCGFKCIISGERFDEIHHLVSLNIILKSVYNKMSFDLKTFDINKITEEKRQAFLNEFYIEQAKYPLGVCLKKDIHMQFHNVYGYGDNTVEQFYEFIKDFYPNINLNI